MFTDTDLQELLQYQAKYPVLSVYLNTDPAEGNADTYKLHLRSMLKEVDLPKDTQVVLRYFDHEHDWSGRSVAIFTCASENFMRAYPLAVPIRNRVRISDRPHVKPLIDVLDSYGRYGVVLVDKQSARLFYFHLGELKEQDGVIGESIRRTKRGGGSQFAGRRGGIAGQTDYTAEVAERNMKEAVEYTTRFLTENNVRRVLIGGTEDNVAMFRSQLPKVWQSLVIGTFPISMLASHNEILERAMEIGKVAELQREAQLASAAVTGAAKGRGGVINLEETLHAAHEGRIQTLLIREGYRSPGYQCQDCGYLSSLPIEACPFCSGRANRIPDVIELAVRHILNTGGEVEVLPNDLEIEGFDKIGAILRY